MSFGTLRREQMGGATGIYNLMRNLGGSIGISMATTLLARRAQVHQNVMVAQMTPYDPVYQQRLEAIRRALDPQGRAERGRASRRSASSTRRWWRRRRCWPSWTTSG